MCEKDIFLPVQCAIRDGDAESLSLSPYCRAFKTDGEGILLKRVDTGSYVKIEGLPSGQAGRFVSAMRRGLGREEAGEGLCRMGLDRVFAEELLEACLEKGILES